MHKYLYCILSSLLLIACTEDYNILNNDQPQMIVEGWIESGDYPVVILTRSLPVKNPEQIENLDDYIIKWAKVIVSNETDSVVLTGKYDESYFPPYIYTTGHLKGEIGKKYTLKVKYRDFQATATTTIPAVPSNCSLKIKKCNNSDSLYQISAEFVDNPNEKNYYQFFTRIATRTKQYQASYLGTIDDVVLKGNVGVPVYRGRQIQQRKYIPYFMKDEIVHVKFAQIDEISFKIWDSYTKTLSLSSNMFLSTSSNMETNIEGGFGYWCGYGAITYTIIIR